MTSQKSKLRYLVLVAVASVTMFALACGGSDDDGGENPTSVPGSQGNSSPTATPQSSSSSNIAVDTGVVTVGTKKFEFSMADFSGFDRCITAFGVVAGTGEASDGTDVDLEFDIPPVGYETQRGFEDYGLPSIQVDDNESNQQWTAGGDFTWMPDPPEPDESRIDSYTSKDGVVSGSATFIDTDALSNFSFGGGGVTERPKPVTGTFELHCGA